MHPTRFLLALLLAAISTLSVAGFYEGLLAAQNGDYHTALQEWQPLAKQGHAGAQFNLGVMYENSQGVPKDFAQAVAWYRKAAEQGHALAQYNLGGMYYNGQGVLKDFAEAAVWYRKAAEQGDAGAQNNLGVMYANGEGVAKNLVIAYALQNLSQAAGNELARSNLSKNETAMQASEIAAAQHLSREMSKPGNLLNALDTYAKRNPTKKQTASSESSNNPFPARPAKRPGVTSCNTNCNNGDCYRTYDNGKKVRFRAKQTFDPFTNQMTWDSGSC